MAFIKNIWYGAAWGSEVAAGAPVPRTIADLPIVLYRKSDGEAVALEDRCSHRCAPLSKGRVEGDAVRCWYHGLLFNSDGKCVEMPGQDLAPGFDVHAYPVVERHGCVWVWTGDPGLADPALIPNSRLTENGIPFRTGVLQFACDYQLMNDNLCDFSHLAYVHEKTLGQGNQEWAQRQPTVTNLANGIRSTRWLENTRVPPMPGMEPGTLIDQYTAYDYVMPGVLIMQIDNYPLGTAKACDFGPPPQSMEGAVYVLRTLQMVTPITAGKTRYLYSVSHPIDPAPGQSLDPVIGLFEYAFGEDRDMIEAQQAAIGKYPNVVLRNTKHDAGLTRLRRLTANKIQEEQAPSEARSAAE